MRAYLGIRETNGYSIQYAEFYPARGEQSTGVAPVICCLVFIGLPSNPQFVGPQDPQTLAEHILASRGPSGENREYLYELHEALQELDPESGDFHVDDLTRRCRDIEGSRRLAK